MFRFLILISFAFHLLISCENDFKTSHHYTKKTKQFNEKPIDIIISQPANHVTIFPDSDSFTENTSEILTISEYHGDEISNEAKLKKWFALSVDKLGNYNLKQTELKFESVFDEILDEDTTRPSGIKVSTTLDDSVLFLFGNVPMLKNGEIKSLKKFPTKIKANTNFGFNFLGKNYYLKAKGDVVFVENQNYSTLENYELFLDVNDENDNKTTLISSFPYFDDSEIEILFIGDLDQDGKVDLIIDNSPKYNSFTPTLYLSSVAPKNKLVKVFATSYSVGC